MGWRTEAEVTRLSDDPDVVVDVIGFQWQWQFKYPDHDIVVQGTPDGPPTMVVPVGSTVRLRLHANDVIHSFWVPEFLEKRDLIPEIDNQIDVDVTKEGTWQGRCAEYCGLDHWRMYFGVKAVPRDEFDEWVRENEGRTIGAGDADANETTTTTTGADS
jgi:cytochrome c oxidase subunit 2